MIDSTTTEPRPLSGGAEPLTDYKGRTLCLYHANLKGTGSALRLEPRINRDDRDRYNCIFLEMASQLTAPSRRGGGGGHATFDWRNKVTVKLGFADLAELLTVLEGGADHAGGARNGLYHAAGGGNTLIGFRANRETGAYHLSVSAKRRPEEEARKIGITLTAAEATGLRCLLQTGLFFVTFSSLFNPPPGRPRTPIARMDGVEV